MHALRMATITIYKAGESDKLLRPEALSLEGPVMLPIITYISAPNRSKAPTLRLSGTSRLLAPRLFCLFDGVPLRVSNRYS
jgi:hypothetical protein